MATFDEPNRLHHMAAGGSDPVTVLLPPCLLKIRASTCNMTTRVAADLFEQIEMRTISGPVSIIALAGYAASLMIASRKT